MWLNYKYMKPMLIVLSIEKKSSLGDKVHDN